MCIPIADCIRYHIAYSVCSECVNINSSDGQGFRNAVNWSKSRVYKFLLTKPELDLSLRNRDGETALHRAAIQCCTYTCIVNEVFYKKINFLLNFETN